jgi:hypothetical protein
MRIHALVASSLVLALAFSMGCGGGDKKPPETPAEAKKEEPAATDMGPEEKKEEPAAKKEEAPVAKKKISEIISGGGTWAFSLADSPDAKKAAEDGCKKKNKDAAKQEACMKDVEKAASAEGFRYEKDDKGNWWWVSFASEKDKEVVVNKLMFKIESDGEVGGSAKLKPEGKDMGKKPMAKLPAEVVIEMPDESTTVMTDPKKGKLTFKKK